MTTSSMPTLPPNWDPPGCLQKDDYWQWDYKDRNNRPTVLGGPSQTVTCLPSTWASTSTYVGTACPTHYSNACPFKETGGIVTCCPEAYKFTCIDETFFKCRSEFEEDGGFLTASKINMYGNSPAESTTLSQRKGSNLVAPGLLFKRLEIKSTATTATPTSHPSSSDSSSDTSSDSSSDSSSDGLSTGAKAGVGVGVAVGVLLVVAIACWLLWRRKKTKHQPQGDLNSNTQYAHNPTTYDEAKTTGSSTVHSPSTFQLDGSHPVGSGPHEMQDANRGPHEMQHTNRGAELPA